MTTFSKKVKFRKLIICFSFLLGFLFLFTSFIVIGLLVYPHLVLDCEIQIDSNSENKISDHNFFSKSLYGIGICREVNYNLFKETAKFNISKEENPFVEAPRPFSSTDECHCPSKKTDELGHDIMKGNEISDVEFRTYDKCICNKTQEINEFKETDVENKNENNDSKPINGKYANYSINNLKDSDEIMKPHNFDLNECDCTNKSKVISTDPNAKSFEENYICKCPDVYNDTFDDEEIKSMKEKSDNKSLDFHKCECPIRIKEGRTIFNASGNMNEMSSVKLGIDECVCPETYETDDINKNETNKSKTVFMESLTEEEPDHDFHFTETENEKKGETPANKDCICPKTHNMDESIFNETQTNEERHDNKFDQNGLCICPELHEIDNLDDIHETASESQKNEEESIKFEKCECPTEPKKIDNETIINIKKFGIKNLHGECVCTDTQENDYSSTNKATNEDEKYHNHSIKAEEALNTSDFYFNETKNGKETLSINNDRCFCPKTHRKSGDILNKTGSSDDVDTVELKENNECKCADPDILEINNFDLHDEVTDVNKNDFNALQAEECLCPQTPMLLQNRSRVENTKPGFKDANGTCACPELDFGEAYLDETETVNHEEVTSGYEIDTANKGEMEISNDFDTLKHKECLCPQTPMLWENGTRVENTKIGFKEADGKCACPELDFGELYVNETETVNPEEITTGYEMETVNKGEMTDTNETKFVSQSPLVHGDKKETPHAKMFTNSD